MRCWATKKLERITTTAVSMQVSPAVGRVLQTCLLRTLAHNSPRTGNQAAACLACWSVMARDSRLRSTLTVLLKNKKLGLQMGTYLLTHTQSELIQVGRE